MEALIHNMPRPRWPHLVRQRSRHGRVCWYVRQGHGPRIRLLAPFGSPEFKAEYQAALSGEQKARAKGAMSGTLLWLWERYCDSSAWTTLSPATRRQRENIMKRVLERAGGAPLSAIDKKMVMDGRDRRKATPSQANNFLKLMDALFVWAVEAGHVASNPAETVKPLNTPKTGGFQVWTEEEIARFEAYWLPGTRERLALAILLYTGMRRGDAARLGRQHVRDGIITFTTEKTGTKLTLPVFKPLAEAMAAVKPRGLTFIAQESGEPMTKESFGNWFREACDKAGCAGSAHGLRKAAATRAAMNGATVAQLKAFFGWKGDAMPSLYTKSADSVKLAKRLDLGLGED